MLMFEYSCCGCKEIFEVYQKINEDKLNSFYCPACGKIMPVKRLIGSRGFVLGGNGWSDSGYQKEMK